MPKTKTLICIKCLVSKTESGSGRFCHSCRYALRKQSGEAKRYYLNNRETILLRRKQYHYGSVEHRRRALAKYGAKCFDCGWNKAQVVLHVHHIDCNHQNGDISNLVMLCPTCHYYRHFLQRTAQFAFYSKNSLK